MGMSDQNSEAGETEEYEVERYVTREDGAVALRLLADGVANGSVELGDDGVTATVPERFELEIEYEQESEEAELEVELEWPIVDGEAVMAEQESETQEDDERDETAIDDGEEEVGTEDESTVEADVDRPIDEVVGTGDTASNAQFELYRDRADEWRWRLVHDNGNIIADSGEGYDRIATARNGLESVMRNAPGATVIETDD